MYDFLKFIDSPDIREYNKDTYFTPAEWAALIGLSIKRTVEEKIEALQYLIEHYDEKDFAQKSVNIEPRSPRYESELPSRYLVAETIQLWKDILCDRYNHDGFLYAAMFSEKTDYIEYDMSDYHFFSSYEKAYSYLEMKKQEYHSDEASETFGRIHRIRMDDAGGHIWYGDWYIFDTNLQIIDIFESNERKLWEDGRQVSPLNEPEYQVFVPLPFKKGDIVKVDSLFCKPYYGVISCDWKKPEKNQGIKMWISLETYDEVREDFDFTDGDGDCVLNYSYCPDEELPEDEQVLKLISAVRKGDMDFYTLLHKFGRKELGELLKHY